jgi:hypothetical protein
MGGNDDDVGEGDEALMPDGNAVVAVVFSSSG